MDGVSAAEWHPHVWRNLDRQRMDSDSLSLHYGVQVRLQGKLEFHLPIPKIVTILLLCHVIPTDIKN